MKLCPAWQPVTKPNGACTFTIQELILCALRSHETKRTLDRFLRTEHRKNSVGCERALSRDQPLQASRSVALNSAISLLPRSVPSHLAVYIAWLPPPRAQLLEFRLLERPPLVFRKPSLPPASGRKFPSAK